MNVEELKREVARGEDSHHQFKADLTIPDALAAEVVAFLNAEGGTVYIGVDDAGTAVGLDSDGVRRINQMISNVASQHIRNPIALTTENIALDDGRIVIVLHVPSGIDKPYFDKNGAIWLKEGADKRRVVSREEVRRLFEASEAIHADEQPTRAGLDRLDQLRLRPFFEKSYGVSLPTDSEELLRIVKNMNLATNDGKLNLAGLVMFGLNPEFIVPQFSIKAVRANGKDISFTSFQDKEDFSGTIQDMYAGAISFVMRNMRKVQRAESVNMPGESEIPRVVFEELIVNALVHRSYFIDAPIRILMFDDRVEIISPGSLPNHLTVEKILAGNANIRNPIIASYVARGVLPYWGLGSGIRRAKAAWSGIDFIDDKAGVQFKVVVLTAARSVDMTGGGGKLPIDGGKLPIDGGKLPIDGGKLPIDGDVVFVFERILAESRLSRHTVENIRLLKKSILGNEILGRRKVAQLLNLSERGAGDLIKTMVGIGLLRSVQGFGKGKYRFFDVNRTNRRESNEVESTSYR